MDGYKEIIQTADDAVRKIYAQFIDRCKEVRHTHKINQITNVLVVRSDHVFLFPLQHEQSWTKTDSILHSALPGKKNLNQ